MEMTKWFDTNYHYLVPELGPDTLLAVVRKPFDEHAEAMEELGIDTRAGADRAGLASCCSPSRRRRRRGLRPAEPARAAARGLRRGDRAPRRAGRRLGPARRALLRRGPHRARARRPAPRLRGARQGPRAAADRWSRPTSITSATPTRCCASLPIEGHRPRLRRAVPRRTSSDIARGDGPARRTSGWSPASSTAATSGSTTSTPRSTRSRALQRPRRRAWSSPPPALFCTCRSTSTPRPRPRRRAVAPGWPSPSRRSARSPTLAKGLADGREAIADELAANAGARDRARLAPHPQPGGPRRGSRPSPTRCAAASPYSGARGGPAAHGSACRRCPTTTIGSYPADRRDPRRARRAARRARSTPAATSERMRGEIDAT